MMEFLTSYWAVLIALISVICVAVMAVVKYLKLPSAAQLAQVQAWLLYAVTQAETELGSSTGQLKLVWVYDLFVERFSWLASVISYEDFSGMVDNALDSMAEMLGNNAAIAEVVYGEVAEVANAS